MSEVARLFQGYEDSLESIAVKTITVLQVLLLQKLSHNIVARAVTMSLTCRDD